MAQNVTPVMGLLLCKTPSPCIVQISPIRTRRTPKPTRRFLFMVWTLPPHAAPAWPPAGNTARCVTDGGRSACPAVRHIGAAHREPRPEGEDPRPRDRTGSP